MFVQDHCCFGSTRCDVSVLSHDASVGAGAAGGGRVRVEVSPALPGPPPLVRELSLPLSSPLGSVEEVVFLSPL